MMHDPIVGEFVNLRPLAVGDAALTLRWREAERARFLNAVKSSLIAQERWIKERPITEFNFIIELKDSRPVGMLSLINVDLVNRHAESGRFLIGEEESTKGIPAALEAMKLLYQLAFDELDLIRVFGTIASGNKLMIKWQKYLGMKEEGRLRNHYFIGGEWQDAVVLGLLAEEARAQSFPRMNSLIAAARRNPS